MRFLVQLPAPRLVAAGNVPGDFELEQSTYEFDLVPGQIVNIDIQLKVKAIEVEIIKTGEELKIEK